MGKYDVFETAGLQDVTDALLMLWVHLAMEQRDRRCFDTK